ncbi:hypothetical protein [Urbifossiella limnaea]|uniref:PEP-CTERM sorting domain-containing protein n=1 Tax=Urbifossiella limnaea TaxID=2528023 RepID=A0A517Y349_9BACT|nr:hypothetical protein [Urbifossiella limnaea]QDU24167.1 hypothetical protein ETAA1_61810 [Urbifossiella limnaea]
MRRCCWAIAAVAATLWSPSTGSAAFTLLLQQGSQSQSIELTPGNVAGTVMQTIMWKGFEIDVIASTNTPGGPVSSFVTDTTLAIRNKSAGSGGLSISLKSDGFTFPAAGTDVAVKTDLATKYYFDPAGVVGSSAIVYDGKSFKTLDTEKLIAAGESTSRVDYMSIKTTPFSIMNTMSFNGFGMGDEAFTSITTTVTSVTPAPAGVVLAASGAPFLGLATWFRRRGKPKTIA